MDRFLDLLRRLLSPENQLRATAEQEYESLVSSKWMDVMGHLLKSLDPTTVPETPARHLSCVLLRQLLRKNKAEVPPEDCRRCQEEVRSHSSGLKLI